MSLITIFKNYYEHVPYDRHINDILNRIKTGASEQMVNKYRLTGNKELKKKLPSILFSGQFTKRNSESILKHSGFICLDFDKFPDSETLTMWKDNLEGDNYTYCVFLSPSGYGLKCIVKIPPIVENHKSYFDALRNYYKCEYFDIHCSDVSRICFESYDPYLTISQNSLVWDKTWLVPTTRKVYIPQNIDESKTASNLLKWWHRKFGLYTGSRNANVFKLCAAFNDYGISKEYALSLISEFQQEDFRLSEIEVILQSAYRKTDKFGTLKF